MTSHDWFGVFLVAVEIGCLGYLIWRFGFRGLYDMTRRGYKLIWLRILEGAPPARNERDREIRDREIRRLERELGIGGE